MSAGIPHGGALDTAIAEFGGERDDWLDLSTGINPEPYPVHDLSRELWAKLPDHSALSVLEDTAREYYRVPEGFSVVAAPGTQSLIEMLPQLLPGNSATIIARQTGVYGEHAYCCEKAARETRLEDTPSEVADAESMAVLVHPNNPDGHVWPADQVEALAVRMLGNGYLVIDEAFCDTIPEHSFIPNMQGNMIVLRSFGKFFGLAGLRLGFAICYQEIATEIRSRLGPWAVSGPALAIGAKAFADRAWIERTKAELTRKSALLVQALEAAGLEIVGANPLFLLARCDGAAELHERLSQQHILVRSFERRSDLLRFGLPADEHELDRFVAALIQTSGARH